MSSARVVLKFDRMSRMLGVTWPRPRPFWGLCARSAFISRSYVPYLKSLAPAVSIGSLLWQLRYLWPFGSNLPSNVCDAQVNRGWVTLGQNFGCSLWSRSVMLGCTESEHPTLTKSEIIFEQFQPMWSRYLNVKYRRTDGRTVDLPYQ